MALPTADVEELSLAQKGLARVDRRDRALLRVVGPERVSWLQGMVTNDVAALATGASQEAAVLSPKGAMVAALRVLAREDELLLELPALEKDRVLAHLNGLLISEDCELTSAQGLVVVGLIGPQAQGTQVPGSVGSLPGPLPLEVDHVVPETELAQVEAALASVPVLSSVATEVLRIEAGVPVWGKELLPTTIPLEANLERAINYKKGCYVGQEVIARGTYRGQMNKRLVGLALGDAERPAGTELFRDGKKVGVLTSAVRGSSGEVRALGYVHRDSLTVGTQLDAAGAPAVVSALPFGS